MFYNNIDLTNFVDNKTFWKNVNPLFSNKNKKQNKITLVENNNIIADNGELAEVFNDFFKNAVRNLNIEENVDATESMEGIDDPIDAALKKFQSHPSILKIMEVVGAKLTSTKFDFKITNVEDIKKELSELNVNKSTTYKNIPAKILKTNSEICAPYIESILNLSFEDNIFPDNLKLADVSPVFKAGDDTIKKNYRPVSVLPVVSKIKKKHDCPY